jgi:hypothetical protein
MSTDVSEVRAAFIITEALAESAWAGLGSGSAVSCLVRAGFGRGPCYTSEALYWDFTSNYFSAESR